MLRDMGKLRHLIDDARASLKWPVNEVIGHGYFEIHTDPHKKDHTISWPQPNSPGGVPRDIEVLHELLHAQMAETIHPQFGSAYFKRGTPDELVAMCELPYRAACDWFVDARLYELCPEIEGREIREHLDMTLEAIQSGRFQHDINTFYFAALIISQAMYHLRETIRTAGMLKKTINAFLSIPPENPTLAKLEALTNKLLKIHNISVELIEDGGIEVWQIHKKQKKGKKRRKG